MLEILVPGYPPLHLSSLVLDYNGTLACDGEMIPGARQRLDALSRIIEIHVLTADTFGDVRDRVGNIPCRLAVIAGENQAEAKLDYTARLGFRNTACIGNGRNDRLMLKEAALGIAVVQEEGTSVEAVFAADVVVLNIVDALDLLLHPLRLTATLRS